MLDIKCTQVVAVMAVIMSLFSIDINSQNLYFKHLGINDGLSQVTISSIYQDEFGVMWIGTSEGLNRYNGVSMIKFGDNKYYDVWANRDVTKITGDRNGSLYVISGNSLISISLQTEKTVCLKEGGIYDIFSEKDTLWCSCEDGIFYYTRQDKNLKFFTRRDHRLYKFSKIAAKGDKIYAATAGSVFIIDKQQPSEHDKITDLPGNVLHIYVDKRNNIWACTGAGVCKIAPDRAITHFDSTPGKGGITHRYVRCITEDAYGNIWLGTFLGLDCYHYETGEWKHYTQYGDSPNTLSHNSIVSLDTDDKGNIWAGTYFGGVNIFNPDPRASYFYHAAPLRGDWLNFNVVSEMVEDDQDNIWICTEGGGLNILNPADGKFKHLIHKTGDAQTPGNNNLKSIYYHPVNGKMYIGTHWGGLYIYDTKLKKGYSIQSNGTSNSLPNNIVNEVIPYKEGLILLTQGGVVYMDVSTDKFSKLSVDGRAAQVLGETATYETLTLDCRERLWLGHSEGGVTCVNLRTSDTEYFKLDSLKKSKVTQIYEDPRGEIYVCTLGAGLFHYVNHKNAFTPYNVTNLRMPSDYCYYACSSHTPGHLYILNGNGISLFDTQKEREIITNRVFNQSYGNGSAIFRHDSGKLYIGGTNGLAVINEERFTRYSDKDPVVLDRLFVYNHEILPGDSTGILTDVLQRTKSIELNHRMNNVTFEFSTFNYIDNIRHPYEYILEGFDNSWNVADGMRVSYTSLPPGNYTLKVRNIIPGYQEEVSYSSIDIVITPPFYANNTAYVLYIIAILLITVLIIRAIVRQATLRTSIVYERNEKNRIKELNKMKIDFFTNISHEFHTPITLILVQLEGLIHYENITPSIGNKLQKVYKNALNLLNLSSELTDFDKLAEGKIKVEELDIVGYTKQIYASFSELAKSKKIGIHFSSSSSRINIWFDPRQMYKALFNLLDNAFKYNNPDGKVSVAIKHSKAEVQLSITDTGIGIPQDKLLKIFSHVDETVPADATDTYNGKGLSIAKKIVEMHHGTLSVESTPGKGTVITIALLTGSHQFSPEELNQNDENRVVIGTEYNINLATAQEVTDELVNDGDTGAQKPEILLVEDNEELCQILNDVLQPIYTLHISHNGIEGFEMAGRIHPDMIICDQHLPGMSGKDLCYKIKNNVELADISIIMTTNACTAESMVETLLMGADEYMAKPFDVRLLYARIRSILKNKKRLVAWCGSNVSAVTTEADAVSESDRKFLKKCIEIIRNNFDNSEFDVTKMSNELCMGRSTFYTKFKQIVGIPPNEFIAKIKLEEAMRLLKDNPELSISEISIRLGFSSPRYFSRIFKSFYGSTPQSVRK